jgi:hypothetical protein
MVGEALTRNEDTEAATAPARLRRRGLAVLCLVALALLAGRAQAAKNDVELVRRAPGASGAKGDGISELTGMSSDGRIVVFDSVATNLSPDDGDATTDVYVRDLQTNTTTLVSRANGVGGVKGNGRRRLRLERRGEGAVRRVGLAEAVHPGRAAAGRHAIALTLKARTGNAEPTEVVMAAKRPDFRRFLSRV